MFEFKFSVTGHAQLQKIWELYSNVSNWHKWDSEIESVILEGDFTTNNSGIMKMKNGQSLPFTLESINATSSFVSTSHLGAITIRFGHFIKTNSDDSLEITHTVTISGGEEKQMEGMGKGITSHIPESMTQLLYLSK